MSDFPASHISFPGGRRFPWLAHIFFLKWKWKNPHSLGGIYSPFPVWASRWAFRNEIMRRVSKTKDAELPLLLNTLEFYAWAYVVHRICACSFSVCSYRRADPHVPRFEKLPALIVHVAQAWTWCHLLNSFPQIREDILTQIGRDLRQHWSGFQTRKKKIMTLFTGMSLWFLLDLEITF